MSNETMQLIILLAALGIMNGREVNIHIKEK
jgi:hypothetical protein